MSYDEHLISMAGGDGDVLDVREVRAKALEDIAEAILTNDPLDYWAGHLPEGLGFQEAMSRWLKAHAAAERIAP